MLMKYRNRRRFAGGLLVLLMAAGHATAPAASASGLESNGIGARGRALGNALVGTADDWTAVFYNPAGLAWLPGDQAGVVYEFFSGGLSSTASLRNLPLSGFPDPSRGDFIDPVGDEPPSFGNREIDAVVHYAEYGCAWNRGRTGYGLAIYGSGSGTAWEDRIATSGGDRIRARIGFTNGAANVPLAAAIRISDTVSLGATLTVRYGLLEVEVMKSRSGSLAYTQKTEQDTEGLALSGDAGALWRVGDRLSLGTVVRFPYRIHKTGTTRVGDSLAGLEARSGTTVREDYPLRIGAGLAYRPGPGDLLGLTVNWMNWADYRRRVSYDDPVPGVLEDSSGNPAHWKNTITAGVGYEKVLNDRWTGRLGLLYDQAPEPERNRTLVGGLVVDSWKFSAGAGIRSGGSLLNLGYSYTYGPEVDGYVPGAGYSTRLHEVYAGLDWAL